MRRYLLISAVAVAALLAYTGAAAAQDPAEPTVPPAFAPPAPAPVTDIDSAAAFAELYATRNAARFLRTDRRRTRVVDANAACLEHPVVAARFGCVFTLRALTFERRGWWGHSSRKRGHDDHGRKHRRPRIRVRTYGCLGLLSVQGGADVTPTGILRAVDCVRVRNGDYDAPEPEPVA